MRVPTAPHPCQHLSLSVFWVLAIPKVCSGITYHIVLICMSLMTYEVEHNFICLFTSCISLLVRYLLRSLLHFLSGLFVFLFLSFKNLLYTLENSSLSDVSFASIFSQSPHSFDVIFHKADVFNFNEVYLMKSFFHGSCL